MEARRNAIGWTWVLGRPFYHIFSLNGMSFCGSYNYHNESTGHLSEKQPCPNSDTCQECRKNYYLHLKQVGELNVVG